MRTYRNNIFTLIGLMTLFLIVSGLYSGVYGGTNSYKFLFGPDSGKVSDGVYRVSEKDIFDASKDYGWVDAVDIAPGKNDGPDDVMNCYLRGSETEVGTHNFQHCFKVKLSPGIYKISVISGSKNFNVLPFDIIMEGKNLGEISSNKGSFAKKTYTAQVLDGTLDLVFGFKKGEQQGNWLVNGVEIIPEKVFTEKSQEEILNSKRVIYVPVFDKPIVADGKLDEQSWKNAETTALFSKDTPLMILPKKQTSVRVGRDDLNLYIAFECLDPDIKNLKAIKVARKEDMERRIFGNDVAEIFIMPNPQKNEWFHIAVDAANQVFFCKESIKDSKEIEQVGDNIRYEPINAVLGSGVTVGSDKWIVELWIPFKTLGVNKPDAEKWGINFCREEPEPGELSTWTRLINGFQQPENFGEMLFKRPENYQTDKEIFEAAMSGLMAARELEIKAKALQAKNTLYKWKNAFSFGPDDAPLKENFKRVSPGTLYTKERGYGWEGNTTGISAEVKKGYETKGIGFNTYSDELMSQYVIGNCPANVDSIENTFRVDIPNGKYKVHMLMGSMGKGMSSNQDPGSRRVFDVYCNGSHLFNVTTSWNMFSDPFFKSQIKDGILRLKFRAKANIPLNSILKDFVEDPKYNITPGWIINSLVIYPVKERAAAEKQIDKDEFLLNYLPYDKLATMKFEEPPKESPLPVTTPDQKKLGCIIFAREPGTLVYQTSVPKKQEITKTLLVTAAPGEVTSTTFAVYPLRNIDDLKVDIADFIGPKNKLTKGIIDIGIVRTITTGNTVSYSRTPKVIEPIRYSDMDLTQGRVKQIWLTVRVPEQTLPGKYRSTITLNTAENRKYNIKFDLQVLPFKLVMAPWKRFGLYEYGRTYNIDMDKTLSDMRDHGMNTMMFYGSLTDINMVKARLELAKSFGFKSPLVFWISEYQFTDPGCDGGKKTWLTESEKELLRKGLSQWAKLVKENNLLTPAFYSWDEPNADYLSLISAETLKTVKEVPGILTYSTCTPTVLPRLEKYLDIKNMAAVSDYRSQALSQAEKKLGKQYWTYAGPIWMSPEPNVARFMYGWFDWSVDLDGMFSNVYSYYIANPYNSAGINTGYQGLSVFPGTLGGYSALPSLTWELTRIGINDQKYIYTLVTLIEKGRKSKNAEAKRIALEEERKLNSITKQVNGSLEYYGLSGMWDGSTYGILRERITKGILRLRKAGIK